MPDVRARWGVRAAVAVLAAGLMLGAAPWPGPAPRVAQAADTDQVDRLKEQIEDIRQQIQKIERQRRRAQGQLSELRRQERVLASELRRLDEQLEVTERRLAQRREELAAAEASVRETARQLQELEQQLEKRDRLRDARVRALYQQGTVAMVEVLLDSRTFADFLRRFTMLRQILAHDVDLLLGTRRLRDDVAAKKRELEQQRARVAALVARIEADRQALERMSTQKERALATVQDQKEETERLLDEMDAQLDAATRRLNELSRQLARLLPKFGGKMLFPVDTSGYWRFSSEFGMRWHPILRRNRMHTGLDIAARKGTKVYAAAPGQVGYAAWMGGYGKVIILIHAGGLQTVYAHLDAILVREGQNVDAGDLIGRVGSTGFSTGPHLHFEVRKDGEPVNPRNYLIMP